MADPYKNKAFTGSEAGDSGVFSANQSKPWRYAENSYKRIYANFSLYIYIRVLVSQFDIF